MQNADNVMTAVGEASSRLPRLDAIPGALDAVYGLFEKMKSTDELPREVTLLQDPDASAILEGRFPGAQAPYTPIKRSTGMRRSSNGNNGG